MRVKGAVLTIDHGSWLCIGAVTAGPDVIPPGLSEELKNEMGMARRPSKG